ncbi:MAG: 2-amino-4-hydroxy-6-hydroxymethyldihydropteridine diphosphokinase, partial [Draconibacterium sp.]|nr:2-amino-4-hydroxy-6-hydroxymethyldihydropteridine diphosphokinase [Draconibacterium sp.]
MHKVFLSIGGNIGDKQGNFEKVYQLVDKKIGKIIQSSSIYETPPWGFTSDDNFWNQLFISETKLEAEEVLWRIHEIED